MKVLARALQALGLLAILAGGAALVVLFEFDFFLTDLLPQFLIGIAAGVIGGVLLIVLSAVLAPGTAKISFPLFRPSRSIDGVDPDPEEKP